VPSSGEHVLFLFAVTGPGATLRVPFDAPDGGRYVFHLEGLVAPDYGDWEALLDGVALPRWEGYHPVVERRRGPDAEPRALLPGPHELVFRCVGRDPRSRGFVVAFDTLEGARVGPLE
jgi:hypothetical protein